MYLVFLQSPNSHKSQDLMIGKGEDWRDKTRFRLELGFAWVDLLFLAPLLWPGCVGVLMGQPWGWCCLERQDAAQSISTSWFTEKELVYPDLGPCKYYTYFWGFVVYWGALSLVYSAMRLSVIEF
jgi:hypothetical protein